SASSLNRAHATSRRLYPHLDILAAALGTLSVASDIDRMVAPELLHKRLDRADPAAAAVQAPEIKLIAVIQQFSERIYNDRLFPRRAFFLDRGFDKPHVVKGARQRRCCCLVCSCCMAVVSTSAVSQQVTAA
ncbi:hypothetical protein, partial [Ensifer sp. Root142]|uniref:hypothetical protein n=1 Tax=Ensifer sp. Root142 TaxID=1736461 RepID=UPI001AEC9D8C